MIGILPAARPDELVYGVVANYARDMYGEDRAAPSRTGWLGLRSATQYGLCDSPQIIGERYEHPERALEQLWAAHSLLPYGVATFTSERRDTMKALLLWGARKNAEVLAEMCLIPIGARRIALGLRWCPECADADRSRFATPYWHRGHQLPGTAICVKHDVWLRGTNGAVRQVLYASPDDVPQSEVRPASRRRIPEPVRRTARLDADWLAAAASIDPTRLRCMLLCEFLRRSGGKRKPAYEDGWRAIDTSGLKGLQQHWLDAGTSSFWAMQPARLVRAAFALGRRDVIAAKVLPLMAHFNLDVDDLANRNWTAELDALLDARGANVRSVQAIDPECRARKEATRRERKNEYKRRWRQSHPERIRAYAKLWLERQEPDALRERRRRWRQCYREKVPAFSQEWRQRNLERCRAKRRRWRQRHPEQARAKAKAWRERNPELVRASRIAALLRNRDKVREAERGGPDSAREEPREGGGDCPPVSAEGAGSSGIT